MRIRRSKHAATERTGEASFVVDLGDGGRYAEADLAQLTEVIDRLQPGWRDEVVASRYLPKMTVMYDHDHVARTTPPGPRIPEVPGLYVAGRLVRTR